MKNTNYGGLQPAQTSFWFEGKVPRNMPLLIQFALSFNAKAEI
jgi:hypothetical protein